MASSPAASGTSSQSRAPSGAKSATATAKPRRRKAAASASGNTRALPAGAAVLAIGAGIAGFLARRRIAAWAFPGSAEHEAPDLALDAPRPGSDGERAPVDFRPDIDAPISPAEREALRPATGPAPSLVAEAGTMNAQTGA